LGRCKYNKLAGQVVDGQIIVATNTAAAAAELQPAAALPLCVRVGAICC